MNLIFWWQLYSTVTLRQGEKKHYNNKVDAYSFAIVLWELLHNKLPFEGMSNLQAAYAAAFKVMTVISIAFSYCFKQSCSLLILVVDCLLAYCADSECEAEC